MMNGEEKKSLDTILSEMAQDRKMRASMHLDIKNIQVCLTGKPDDSKDLGLQGAVAKNTEARERTAKVLWLMVVGFVGVGWAGFKGMLFK